MGKINSILNNIPLPIRLFLGKALLFFVVWKVIYTFFLFDSQLFDKVLTKHVGDTSAFVLNNSGLMSGFTSEIEKYDSVFNGEKLNNQVSAIYHHGEKVLHIANVCNGLELIVLYIGFIVCMPSSFKRKLLYIIFGVIILDLINIFRCVGLIYLSEYFEAYFDFAHHYLFKAIVYLATFLLWVKFSRKISLNEKSI